MLPDESDDLVSNNFNPNLQFEIEKSGFVFASNLSEFFVGKSNTP